MDYKIITPMALWQDFNPTIEPLEVVVNSAKVAENYIYKTVAFTVETVDDGKVRAEAKFFLRKGAEKLPTILFLSGGESILKPCQFVNVMLERGYNVCSVDFGGPSRRKDIYTHYPESLSYCNFMNNRALIYKPTEVDKSMWFEWMKVIRRMITLVNEESAVDSDNLFLMGHLEGGQLAWKVAGIDGRIRAVLPICAAGFTEFLDIPKYSKIQKAQFSDEWECYLAGMSTQAYARMLLCPVFYIMGTNSSYADIDRVGDLFGLIPHNDKYMSFSSGGNVSIDMDNFTSALTYLDLLQKGECNLPHPTLRTYISEGRLYASVGNLGDYEKVEIYCAKDEITPAFRQWIKNTGVTVLNEEAFCELLPEKDDEVVFVYANVILKNGIILSTTVSMVDLDKIELFDYNENAISNERILFSPDMEDVPFSVENLNPVVDSTVLKIKTGPYGLKGFMTTEGRLCTYNIEPPQSDILSVEEFMLQLEAYSEVERDIRIVMYTSENSNTKYTYKLHLNRSKRWQRFTLSCGDFKATDRRQLKSWNMAKKMKIKDAENVLFTNILWI